MSTPSDYEAFMDALLQFLVTNVAPSLPSTAYFILGDPGQSAPASLPAVYVVPLFDAVKPYSGIDMDTYVAPIIIVDDLNAYGPPVANTNVPGAYEQPGYRKIMQYAQTTRQKLRAGGAGITVGGLAATSNVPAISYAWLAIDNKQYRAARLALQVQQRRARTALS